MSRAVRFALTLAAGVTVSLTLASCTPVDRLAARIVDEQLVFMVCDRVSAQQIEVLVGADSGGESSYETLWTATGDGILGPGGQVVFGQAPDGFENSVGPDDLPPGEGDLRVVFFADKLDGQGEVVGGVSANFVISDLGTDYWLQQGGKQSDAPCE